VEIKTEAGSNEMTESSHDETTNTGMIVVSDVLFFYAFICLCKFYTMSVAKCPRLFSE